ncbi:MAG: nucleoid occlusion factor SlmA [Cellvibrionales bacterium TMED49]|nr:nucleoid occlusion factor SlmA [Porticoccaceae bacterium]OUU38813.1 MAG: nucleoid occlusion factor SlmA [Cellvibrionales bacterium TMED49]|tara:strand:- start:29 stop:616 length:588 start_codon:yes stop_codon:yes gene_type:complete
MSPQKGSRAQEILRALARMLESSRGKRITTAALASELGVSEAALYRHFPSKTRMFGGLIDFIEETVFARVSSIIDEKSSPKEQCFRILTLTLNFAEKNPGITRILNGDALTGETEQLHRRVAQFYDRLESQLKQILREAQIREGLKVNVPVSVAVNFMLCNAEGKIHQFVRSDFKQLPSTDWNEQWKLISAAIFQ